MTMCMDIGHRTAGYDYIALQSLLYTVATQYPLRRRLITRRYVDTLILDVTTL